MKKRRKLNRADLSKGVYVIPNLVTALNMFFGFFGVIAAMHGEFFKGAVCILLAGLFDNLDGKIARATHSTSRFGVEFDSLADLVSFGVAPALLVYMWILEPFGRTGILAAFLFAACGALRLARFNTQVGSVSMDYFVGLPIPAAAGMIAVTILVYHQVDLVGPGPAQLSAFHSFIILALVYLLAFLMVSTVPYNSFKKKGLGAKRGFNALVAAMLFLVFLGITQWIGLFLVGLTYVGSGPYSLICKKFKGVEDEPAEELLSEDLAEDSEETG